MFKKLGLFLLVSQLLSTSYSFAQVNLKELRAAPDTSLVEPLSSPLANLNEINIPIPKLDLSVNYWKHWTRFGLNANQASFSDNWSTGGVNSLALGGLIWHKSELNRGDFQFISEIDLKYGKVKNKDQLAKKNNDRIYWDNKIAYKVSKNWGLFFAVSFESQFDIGYTYRVVEGKERVYEYFSSFMGPGYLTESFGLEYKPDNTFSLRFGTGAAKQTFVLDDRVKPLTAEEYNDRYPDNDQKTSDLEKFGLKPGEKFRNDLAFQIQAQLNRNLSERLHLKADYVLFADYKDVGDPDQRLDATLTAKVTNLVNVSLSGTIVYKSDQSKKVQYNQALAMGLTFALPR